MSSFSKFMDLPPEIRFMVWREALDQHARVIKLDAHVQTAVFSDPETERKERIVFGGRFLSTSYPEEKKELVWPARSEALVQNISLACAESRQAVLDQYPDLIRVEEPEPFLLETPPLGVRRWVVKGGLWHNTAPRRRTIRCSLKSDYICFDKFEDGCHTCRDGMDFARAINDVATSSLSSGIELDPFVSCLNKIQHLAIESPWKQRESYPQPHSDSISRYLEHQYMNVVSGISSLKTLSVFRNNIPPYMKNPTEAVWEKLFTALPCTPVDIFSNDAFMSIRKFYNALSFRLMGEAYRTVRPSAMLSIYRDVEEQVSPHENLDAFHLELRQRLNKIGLEWEREESKELEVVPHTSDSGAKQDDVLVMPQISIIESEWPQYPAGVYF